MKVLITASEAVPYAKTGGLADVTGSLADELASAGIDVMLVLPLYKGILEDHSPEKNDYKGTLSIDKIPRKLELHTLKRNSGVQVVFIANKKYFLRDELYSTSEGEYADNDERFSFFSKAVLEAAKALDFIPDVIHLNDWQSALIPAYLKTSYRWDFPTTQTLFTIHNLGYQGLFPPESMRVAELPYEFFTMQVMEFYGKVNYLKAGLIFSDAINTVSKRYAQEILMPEYGFGLDGVLRDRRSALSGITNGIDQKYWNPETDKNIPARYSIKNMSGKHVCKDALIEKASFAKSHDSPIIGMVGRLATQKGFDILLEAMDELLEMGIRFAILGRGEDEIQDELLELAENYPEQIFLSLEFDEPLAHLIYAGSDMFLMPSQYEPCGLAQMISMRYGTPPVVRDTGGLHDTVTDVSGNAGTGFVFKEHTSKKLKQALIRALDTFNNRDIWDALQKRCMAEDFSWKKSAGKYIDLYHNIHNGVNV
jgi:starch synthase